MKRSQILLVLALAGMSISAYLAAYQLGLIANVWDPLFADGSRLVLRSAIATALPVPDALIGLFAYALEAAIATIALTSARLAVRATLVLAALASVSAVVGIVLAFLQPLVARSFCSLCLCSSAISVTLAIGAIAEARDRKSIHTTRFTQEADQ